MLNINYKMEENLEDKYEQHLKTEKFEGITFKELYNNLEKKENEEFYNGYNVDRNEDFIYLEKDVKDSNRSLFYFSKEKKIYKVEISDGNKKETKDIISTYEIINFLQKYPESHIYFGGEKFNKRKNYMFFVAPSYIIKFNYIPNESKQFEGNGKNIEHTKRIKKYLEFESFLNKEYYYSQNRTYLYNILFLLQSDCQGFNLFKFTGLSGIGKTFFLYRYAKKKKRNRIYINLKVLYKIYESFGPIEMKNYLITELNNITPIKNNNIQKINEILKSGFSNLSYYLKKLVIYLIESNLEIIIIFDQFKYKYINHNDLNQIEKQLIGKKDSNFKMVICSNINDNFIRESCLKLWDKNKKECSKYIFPKQDIQKLFLNILIMHLNL